MENETITFDDFWNKFIEIAEKNQPYNKLLAKAVWYSLTKLEQENAVENINDLEYYTLGRILIKPFKYLLQFRHD